MSTQPTHSVIRKSQVGDMRPSQVLTTFGVGSIVDLPNLSVMVMGLEDWPVSHSSEIAEERLLASVQRALGGQVKRLLAPPRAPETGGFQPNWFDEAHQVGVPVAPFPRWMVCSHCRLLAPLSSGLFEPKVVPYRPDKTCYIHNCRTQGRPPAALPARFIVACANGHLDDFPWLDYVHRGPTGCNGPLYLYEVGASGEAADVEVKCSACSNSRRMAEAFGRENEVNMPPCRGRHPHLRTTSPNGCDIAHVRAMLQGASNSWFPMTLSVLSVPQATDRLAQLVDDNWPVLEAAESEQNIALLRRAGAMADFGKYDDSKVWQAVQRKRAAAPDAAAVVTDLKTPEWRVFSNPNRALEARDFRLRVVDPPSQFTSYFERIVLVERLREVRALIGFTRIESARDFDSAFDIPDQKRAPLSRREPVWVPASETRGEGIFFHFAEEPVRAWVARNARHNEAFFAAHRHWRATKDMAPDLGFPGLRYVLLHTFAHAVMRQLSVECGYTTASIAERIYSQDPVDGEPMAGVLIYTAASDSEGTLGGLCSLGQPTRLGRHLEQALDRVALCASDPLCAEHWPAPDGTLHGAACHACTFLPETSCERGNKYLDRSVLVGTVEKTDLAFFG